MKARLKVGIDHDKGDGSTTYPYTKRLTVRIDLLLDDVKRGDAVIGTVEKSLAAANKAVVDVASRY